MSDRISHKQDENGEWEVEPDFLKAVHEYCDDDEWRGISPSNFQGIDGGFIPGWRIPEELIDTDEENLIELICRAINSTPYRSPTKRVAKRAVSAKNYPPATTAFMDVLKRLMDYFNGYLDNMDPLERLIKDLQLGFMGLCMEQPLVHFLNDYHEFRHDIDLWQSQPQPYTAKILAGDCKELLGKLQYLVRVK